MRKYLGIILLLVAFFVIGTLVYFYAFRPKQNSNYSAEKSSTNNLSNSINTNSLNNSTSFISKTTVEKEISTFSTKITNIRDTNRQGNITITCSSLNNTIVKSGETFSFCDTVGASTVDRGYKEANIIIKGTETKGLGGGNCQVSSTLYNAVLAVPDELTVIERHPHSAPVPYIEEGKDAAVSYGSHDFKFRNDTNSDLKIIAENTTDNITIKLIKLIKE